MCIWCVCYYKHSEIIPQHTQQTLRQGFGYRSFIWDVVSGTRKEAEGEAHRQTGVPKGGVTSLPQRPSRTARRTGSNSSIEGWGSWGIFPWDTHLLSFLGMLSRPWDVNSLTLSGCPASWLRWLLGCRKAFSLKSSRGVPVVAQ